MMTLALLIGSAIVSQADDPELAKVKVDVLRLGVAPKLEPFDWSAYPDPRAAPEDGKWVDVDGQQRPAGAFLQSPLDRALVKHLMMLEKMPRLCQAQLNGLTKSLEHRCEIEKEIQLVRFQTDQVVDELQQSESLSVWDVLLWTAVGAGVGFAAGVVTVVAVKN